MSREKFVYEIAAYGADVPKQAIVDSLAAIGLKVAIQAKEDSLYAVLKKLPRYYPCFADRCHEFVFEYNEMPKSWYDYYISEDMYLDFEDRLKVLHTDSIVDTAGVIRRFFMCDFNVVQAERITADFLLFAYAWMQKEGAEKDG